MLSIVKSIKKEVSRECTISENDRTSFSTIDHIQRYNPMLELFPLPENIGNKLHLELPSMYQVSEWIEQYKPNFWKATRKTSTGTDVEPCEVYTKIVHLLNPIDLLKERYIQPAHPFLPQVTSQWKETVQRVHSQNNQAYIDYTLNYILSRFREMDLTPHTVLFYGSFTGISSKYKFNITNEYDTYRNCRWFWDGVKERRATIVVNEEVSEEIYNEIITPPFDEDEEVEVDPFDDVASVGSAVSVSFDTIESDSTESFESVEQRDPGDPGDPVLELEELEHITIPLSSEESDLESQEDSESQSESESESESQSQSESQSELGSQEDSDGSDSEIEISLELSTIPVITIAQEAQEGIMDTLLDEDEIDGCEHGSAEWEKRWIAWLFQVISVLTFLQSTLHFTHNDLHSNNILWRSTDKPYLYYSMKDGTTWRVPTYGKIFSIIDFGRAIFRLGKRNMVSDDHWPEQDASDQYNFGTFYNPKKPKCTPNMSFDLCRLSVSLIDGLFDDIPSKKKGKKIMSQEGSWKVYETKSELYNLLWSWTVDDAGRTIYEDADGNEKYEGFDLYIRIAHDVHSAVPREQLLKPVFNEFLYKGTTDEKIYALGI
jgi:hypothetical protein